MTLIPLISAIVAAPERAAVPTGAPALQPRNSYGAGNRHRPVAALLAIGLPAALVTAVALSPMIIVDEPVTATPPWKSILLPKPKPPEPQPDPKPQTQPPQQRVTAPPSPLPPVAQDPPEAPPLPPYVPPAGTGSGPSVPLDPPVAPPKPKLVLADIDPRFADAFQPEYPAREQRGGIEGAAKVRVLIGTDGRVKAVELISADSPAFFEATKRRALARWRFKPATRGGVPEESWKVMTVRFEIENA
ncbi:TonB-like protein [uncultured Sphingopyxis sp.]|uniref:Protein TonB n=1 Tax=uncultured Sphingopyxis sp. TaxID=310581 RepID=A0A1Y5Q227_9SPHN|nr:energy transducer TonB [uncultured Sphingopyxis sp.]SBV34946.1 TonB-like protein [uncultured Sphingopyxis sp.]